MRIRNSSFVVVFLRVFLGVVVLSCFGPFTAPAHADDAQRAKELFQEGTRYFDLGQFDKAIDAWQLGYREKADPGFLYNIAQAYRLAGDPYKAIFFYKGYLRNSPKAHNRPEVEQKIQALQKQLAEQPQGPARPATPPATEAAPPPAAPNAPSPPPPAPAAPAPAPEASAPAMTSPAVSATGEPGVGATSADLAATAPVPQALDHTRPVDLGVGVGVDGWSSGVQGKADPSFALQIAGGYTLGSDPAAAVRFRLGAALGYTFLKEATSKDTFLSLLVVPTVLIRAAARVAVFGELGVGVVGISGIKPNSVLLDPKLMLKITGTQSLFEIRPSVGLKVQLTPALGLFGAFAIDYSPKGNHFYQPISRTELLVGAAMQF